MKKIISTNPAKNYEVIGEVTVSNLNEIKRRLKERIMQRNYGKNWVLKKNCVINSTFGSN